MGKSIGKNISRNLSVKYGPSMLAMHQKLLDHAKNLATNAIKSFSKRAIRNKGVPKKAANCDVATLGYQKLAEVLCTTGVPS